MKKTKPAKKNSAKKQAKKALKRRNRRYQVTEAKIKNIMQKKFNLVKSIDEMSNQVDNLVGYVYQRAAMIDRDMKAIENKMALQGITDEEKEQGEKMLSLMEEQYNALKTFTASDLGPIITKLNEIKEMKEQTEKMTEFLNANFELMRLTNSLGQIESKFKNTLTEDILDNDDLPTEELGEEVSNVDVKDTTDLDRGCAESTTHEDEIAYTVDEVHPDDVPVEEETIVVSDN